MMVSIANPSIKKEVGVFVPNSQPDSCKILLGFGVRPDNLDPTVVRISYPSSVEGNWSVYVFTLSSLRWDQLDINRLPRESIRFKRSTQAVVGQFIYWVGHERILADSGDSYKHYLLVSFDMINHRFQVIDIPDVVMRGLLVPLYVSNLRNSLVLSGNICIPKYYVFVCCQLSIDCGSITSAPAIMTVPSNHFLKLLGFNNHDLPIVEAATGHIMAHTIQVYMGNSHENVAIHGNASSFFVGPNKESLILAAHPDHPLYCAVYEELEYGVLLPNDVNYSNLVRYVKKKFKVGDANQISLSYKIGYISVNIIDDDDKENEGTVTDIITDDKGRFKMCFIGFGVAIKSFLCYMRPLIIIDGAHLKGTYLGTNLVAVGMDGNNQIIPIATGVSQVARVEGLTSANYLAKPWFLNKTIKGTYEGLFFPVKDVSTWKIPYEIQQVLPPDMGKKQSGRPKIKDRILLQREGNGGANMVRKKLNSTQQEESSQGKNSWSESQQEMYEPQHVTNYTEDMYHPYQEYTDQYFMYQHNPQSANLPMNGLS
ncbi:hypothetical protein Tco_0436686 [Tanacetum coccineum]